MALPTKEEIALAIERPKAIKTSELEGYVPVSGIIGPDSYSGGFCIVFPFVKGQNKKAVRIWHQEIDNIQARYKLLTKDIKHCRIKSLISIEYIESGLTVGASDIDLTLMAWIEGKPLKAYLSSIINSDKPELTKRKDIKALANDLKSVFKEMHAAGFSHGDLQHENIIVTDKGELRLIDYDCFYTPSMGTSFIQTTSGYKGYQHPSRFIKQYVSNGKTDYFSELILFLSILAVANDFSLLDIAEDLDYAFIFTPEDFKDLQNSSTYKKVKEERDDTCNLLLDILSDYLKKDDINQLEPFDVIMERMTKTPEIKSFTFSPPDGFYIEDKIELSWNTEGATTVFLDGKEIKSNNCTRTLFLIGRNSFTLKASNGFKEVEKTLFINVFSLPEICLSANCTVLRKDTFEKSILSWSVNNAYKVFLYYNGISEEVESVGSKTVTPKETTTYILQVIGLDKKRIFEKRVVVGVYAPAIVVFESDKNVVLSGNRVSLNWASQNANEITLFGVGSVEERGSYIVTPEYDTIYKLTVSDHFGSTEYYLPIQVLPLPAIQFYSDKSKLNKDKSEKANISWNIQNATTVSIAYDDIEEIVKEVGTKELQFDKTTEITLNCLALDGKTPFKKVLCIKVYNEARVQFSTDRKFTIPDVPVMLSWNIENSKSVELKGYGKVSPLGSKKVTIKEETTFILVVEDEFSIQEHSLIIKMLPLPVVKSITIPIPEMNIPLNLTINIPKPEIQIRFPQINLPGIDIELPNCPNIESVLDGISNVTQPSLISEIKSIFTHYFKR